MLFEVKYEGPFFTVDAIKAYREVEVYLHFFLMSALDECEYSVPRHGRCTSRENASSPN